MLICSTLFVDSLVSKTKVFIIFVIYHVYQQQAFYQSDLSGGKKLAVNTQNVCASAHVNSILTMNENLANRQEDNDIEQFKGTKEFMVYFC